MNGQGLVQKYLKILSGICKERSITCGLVGALAVEVHSTPRGTHDIDAVIAQGELWELEVGLKEYGFQKTWNPRFSKYQFIIRMDSGATLDLDVYDEHLRDLPISHLIQRAEQHSFADGEVTMLVISPEDVILTKRFHERDKDYADIAMVLYHNLERIDWHYLGEMAKDLDCDLKSVMLDSLQHLDREDVGRNPQAIRRDLKKLIEDHL